MSTLPLRLPLGSFTDRVWHQIPEHDYLAKVAKYVSWKSKCVGLKYRLELGPNSLKWSATAEFTSLWGSRFFEEGSQEWSSICVTTCSANSCYVLTMCIRKEPPIDWCLHVTWDMHQICSSSTLLANALYLTTLHCTAYVYHLLGGHMVAWLRLVRWVAGWLHVAQSKH